MVGCPEQVEYKVWALNGTMCESQTGSCEVKAQDPPGCLPPLSWASAASTAQNWPPPLQSSARQSLANAALQVWAHNEITNTNNFDIKKWSGHSHDQGYLYKCRVLSELRAALKRTINLSLVDKLKLKSHFLRSLKYKGLVKTCLHVCPVVTEQIWQR